MRYHLLFALAICQTASLATGTVIGLDISVSVDVRTQNTYHTTIDSQTLYNPLVHTIGTESLLSPVDSNLIYAARVSSSVTTLGQIRTVLYRIETVNGGAFAHPSVFDSLTPSDSGALGFHFISSSVPVHDPDRIGDFTRINTLFGINNAVLHSWEDVVSLDSPFAGNFLYGSPTENPLGPDFFGGTPTAFETSFVYTVIPSPISMTGFFYLGLFSTRRSR